MLSVWQPANTAFDLWQWFPTVVPLLLLTDQVSQDKISRCWWGAASSTVDFWFPFPGHLPSHLAEGKQNRSLFPLLVFGLLWSFHGISKIWGGGRKLWECLSENPTLPPCRVVDFSPCFKGLASYFPAYGFTLHLHTEIIHSICENHLLKQRHTCLCDVV